MTKSRMASLLLPLAAPAAAEAARPVTAAEAIQNYEEMVAPAQPGGECVVSDDPDAITVCGKRTESNRVHATNDPGARVHGTPNGVDALASAEHCVSRCPQPVQINVFKAADFIARGIKRLLDPDS